MAKGFIGIRFGTCIWQLDKSLCTIVQFRSFQEWVLADSVTRFGDLLDFWKLLKPLAIINLPKSPTVLGNFCVGAKIFNFSSEISFGQLLWTFGDFSLVTLLAEHRIFYHEPWQA